MNAAKLQRLILEGIAHHRAGRLAAAAACYAEVRAAAPKNFDGVHLGGLAAFQEGRAAEAVTLLARAHRIDPRHAICQMRLGLALFAAGRAAEAERHLRAAVQREPGAWETWESLAHCLRATDRLAEAVECHRKVVALQPELGAGWYNYGLTLGFIGRSREALECHERALAADPDCAVARFGRAQALQHCHRIAEAVADYEAFLEREPAHHEARSYRLLALHYLDGVDRERLFAEHRAFGRAVGEFPAPALPNSPEPERRLRVAILSPDLREHSCTYFLEPLLQHLDPAEFELALYYDHFREDRVTARLRARAAVWRNFIGQPGPEVVAAIRANAPDIIIDLAGHTGVSNRLPLYAQRLAPVQATYRGYPDTTGLPAMDYRLTDAIADPEGEADRFATEKLLRFAPAAWAYGAPACAPEPAMPPCAAGEPVTFGCFNAPAKITDSLLALWSRVLQTAPGSRLLLKGHGLGDPATRAAFAARLAAAGLAGKTELLERAPDTAAHLALYRRVDVALDTFPYHGTTTTCEALWMGVPVVTLCGDRHVSRVGASLLHAIGRPEWIAATADDYVRLAAGLAADTAGLAALHAGLRDEMRRSLLCDHAGQSARFGAALRSMWRTWCRERAVAA